MVHSSKELTTDDQGNFSCTASFKYFYGTTNWVSVIVRVPGFRPPAYLGIRGAVADNGVKIAAIIPKGSAEKAGLKAGDIIREFAGTKITDMTNLTAVINKYFTDDEVKIKLIREGNETEISIVLKGNPDQTEEQGFKYAFDKILNSGEKKSFKEVKVKDATLRLDFSIEK